ncbi:MAG: hypothetical protein LBH25_05155 [Fibromonadaceae bacterium]|jgi:hypothetical protein|nr:hypothetical protein [Fibromonadaceae bacterium]
MYSSDEADKFQNLKNLFDEAEFLEKELEIESSAYFQPSVNELRYAGRHLLQYLVSKKEEDYEESKVHILRAIYDARDMLLLLYYEKIKEFEKSYKSVSISSSITNWVQIRARLNKTKMLSADPEFKNKNREEFDKIYNEVKNIWTLMDAAIPELDKQLNTFRRNTIITAISVAVAIISAILAFLK